MVCLYVQDMSMFAAVNAVYKTYFGINPPARCVKHDFLYCRTDWQAKELVCIRLFDCFTLYQQYSRRVTVDICTANFTGDSELIKAMVSYLRIHVYFTL